MQFSILAVVTLISAVMAAGPVRRQTVDVNEASMTDADGNVVAFNSKEVYQANKEAGL
ncbi:hypothetical protein BGZ61DRAFT_528425 [Ilyonectria robusta]|uniref:uncharacterized protein n=1 Tax=Ilyonectria robusta TaxID=1079257 RepID=UPI001E8D8678|nr:uncharacterized protein BGZ61DRAFT_528425 [Ilyonectria robusta]KAH6990479.1 hypothetical protein BKA56DRAFT_667045 [Ilyonectria sp. MPI-CAGE-AT-0026]KAH8735218.1 hypothetical protein BGZ61DRAFT_528425 [Ilyonectria robusta]